MRNPNKLPKGLAEFEASLGDLQFAGGLLTRLGDLPEHGFHVHFDQFKQAMKVVEDAEKALASAKFAARRVAFNVWALAVGHYTQKELQKATGYTDE